MAESVIAPQNFTGAAHFDIANSVFVASNTATIASPAQPIDRLQPSTSSAFTLNQGNGEFYSTEPEWEVYARLLLPRKRRNFERVRRIDYLFNACLPADHPVNVGRVPPEFIQLRGININDTDGHSQHHAPGDYIPSNASVIHRITLPYLPGQPRIPILSCSGGVHEEVGALLILPEGGSQTEHRQYTKFYRYAADCARSRYSYVNGPLARGGVASFLDARPESVSSDFVPHETQNEGEPPKYWFSTCNSALSSSNADNIFRNQSGCVFIRGLKIAVQNLIFATFSKIAAKVP
ncbi:hypothetical protein J3R30DRAFT_3404393 [Lentinula aciculospora]|uniref:Uncharacterized protein n=1 Tax=Lentinula aciculospora TaxID=153920 RepID=A0A9W9DP52_9AGAR|nr:hypothetical protein J3R30DRAFT_3404393 [Lentinula aciculospora]